jgi:DNA polymerase-3 subunit delta
MIILNHPLALAKKNRDAFKEFLNAVPETTALVLVEGVLSASKKGVHWLLDWAQSNSARCWTRGFSLPTGAAMTNWILDKAVDMGGKIERSAAQLLASYIDEDPRLANKEIEKLLTYVDYSRSITEEDVIELVSDVRQGDVFEMVDAIGYGDGKKAMFMLRRLLEDSDALPLFGMIVRQFRLLIQIRELVDQNPTQDHFSIANQIGSHPYPVQKLMPQVQLFNLKQLKTIYLQLSEIDQAIKSGQLESELALDMLIASLAN